MITNYERISKKTSNDEYDSLNENLNTQMQNQTKPFFLCRSAPTSQGPRNQTPSLYFSHFSDALASLAFKLLLSN